MLAAQNLRQEDISDAGAGTGNRGDGPIQGNFPHAVVARVSDVDGAVGGNRDRTGPIQLSSSRRTSVAAESCGAGARNRGHGTIGADSQNSMAYRSEERRVGKECR